MWFVKIIAYILVYIALFVAGIKFYMWGRSQEKKYRKKWTRRLGTLFFFAPVIILLAHLALPVPDKWISIFKNVVYIVDYPLQWVHNRVGPRMGFGYLLLKPVISAAFYAICGGALGAIFDTAGAKEGEKKKKK